MATPSERFWVALASRGSLRTKKQRAFACSLWRESIEIECFDGDLGAEFDATWAELLLQSIDDRRVHLADA